MSRPTKYERAVNEADAFNKRHRTGTPVLFWPGIRPAIPQESVTRGEAWALPSGDAVVRIQGRPGGMALSHIEVIPQQNESEVLGMSIDTDHTTAAPAASGDLPSVTLFSKNGCPDCIRTKARFLARGVPFREINVEEDNEPRAEFGGLTPLEYVKAHYGTRMPTVVVKHGDTADHWSGPRPDKVVETGLLFERLGALVPAGEPAPVPVGV